ncbi:Aste57867_18298 [Aphanomyces stellatus]|uniref:Aste57867_18298 protein n=1 Tax=Aphanomyces stellatus TaxID=120398 RepID=A0A485LA28_9STRA|nr:hypothetical protein As57867_018236 [Aphanomyces stellatus]VFT95035.1 Aste57867_18298 [Aphanomyces stellatus]
MSFNGPSVHISKLSLVYSALSALNLITTPLSAYVSEDLPWLVPLSSLVYDPMDVFTANMTNYFQHLYNNDTFPYAHANIFLSAPSTSTFDIRFPLQLPLVSVPDCLVTLLQFPMHLFYSQGMRDFVCTFLALNDTARRATTTTPASVCYHNNMLGLPLIDGCLWVTPLPNRSESYVADLASHTRPGPVYAWFKLTFRIALTVYIMRVVWMLYYVHYRQLTTNLRGYSVRNQDGARVFHKLVVYLGDPTYFVLSHPMVSLVMVVDFWLSAVNIYVAMGQVSQVTEFWTFARGCFYGSRAVWLAYFTMRCASMVVKRWHWEHKVVSVDPAIVGIAVLLYVGPVVYLISSTRLSDMFYAFWVVLVPAADQNSTIEAFLGVLCAVLLVGSFPLGYAITMAWFETRRPQVDKQPHSLYAASGYNDLKLKIVWLAISLFEKPHLHHHHGATTVTKPPESTGGTMHRLFHDNPRYKKLPLFSLRAADCFVVCYNADGNVGMTLRLSLLSGLDRCDTDKDLVIRQCPADHAMSVGVIDGCPCKNTSLKPGEAKARWLHQGASKCQWVL